MKTNWPPSRLTCPTEEIKGKKREGKGEKGGSEKRGKKGKRERGKRGKMEKGKKGERK